MITTGSKFLYGLAGAALVGGVVFGIGSDWSPVGYVALFSVVVLAAFLGSVAIWSRDANVGALDTEAHASSAANTATARPSMWPFAGAAGAAVTAVGAVNYPIVFKIGVVLMLATLVELTVQAWSERASADPAYNQSLRNRMMHPLELPIAGAGLLAVIIYSFSRIMLAISKDGGLVVFIVMASLLLAAGTIIAMRPKVTKGLIGTMAAVALVGLAATGVATALTGEREALTSAAEEDHFGVDHRECDAETHEWDHDAANNVSATSSVTAHVILTDSGLTVNPSGLEPGQDVLTVAKSATVNVVFVNRTSTERRLTVHYGTYIEKLPSGVENEVEREICTAMTGEDQLQLVTFKVPKSSRDSAVPYTMEVPGVPGAEVELLVP